MKNLIFGIGSGRCGTTSLSSILNDQSGANVTHEMSGKIRLPWEFDEKRIEAYLDSISKREEQIVGDVSFYLINYMPYIINRFPNCKIVALKRNKEETIDSMMRKTLGLNHWVSNPQRFSPFDECFPKFDYCLNKRDRISMYYDLYYDLVDKIENNRIFHLETIMLNNKASLKELFTFCEIDNPIFSIRHLNRS